MKLAWMLLLAAEILFGILFATAHASCLIAGDSIAVGLGQVMTECRTDAKVGISSAAIIPRVHKGYDWVILSSGTNDAHNPRLLGNLKAAHYRAMDSHFIYIKPVDRVASDANLIAAAIHGDKTVQVIPGADREHPRSYRELAKQVRAIMGGGS